MMVASLPATLLLAASLQLVQAVKYSFTAPSQCDPLTIEWQDGEPPFTLRILRAFNNPISLELPAASWDGNSGKYTIDALPLPAASTVLLSLHDKNGLTSGVSTEIMTVDSSRSGAQCNTSSTATDFFFSADSALRQCRDFTFTGYEGATLPVTVYGFVSGGTVFERKAQAGESSFNIVANMQAGSKLLFWMQDSTGRSGGLTDVLTVLTSDESACLDASSPSATPSAGPRKISPDSGGVNLAAIIGSIVGVLAIFGVIAAFLFFRRRWKARQGVRPVVLDPDMLSERPNWMPRKPENSTAGSRMTMWKDGYSSGPTTPLPSRRSYGHGEERPEDPDSEMANVVTPFLPQPPDSASSSSFGPRSENRSSTSKQPLPRQPATPRFIVHTDGGAVPADEAGAEEVVELPPMYIDTRPTSMVSDSVAGSSSTRRDQTISMAMSEAPYPRRSEAGQPHRPPPLQLQPAYSTSEQ